MKTKFKTQLKFIFIGMFGKGYQLGSCSKLLGVQITPFRKTCNSAVSECAPDKCNDIGSNPIKFTWSLAKWQSNRF